MLTDYFHRLRRGDGEAVGLSSLYVDRPRRGRVSGLADRVPTTHDAHSVNTELSRTHYSRLMVSGFGIIVPLVYAALAVVVIVLAILIARLLLAAVRTLDAVTEERRIRIDLLIAERGDDIAR